MVHSFAPMTPLIEPLRGEVKGDGKQTITITFTPTVAATAVCELELHLSEFDAQPIPCRISGSGMPHPPKSPQSIMGSSKKARTVMERSLTKIRESVGGRTLLTHKKSTGRGFLIVFSIIRRLSGRDHQA